VKFETGEFYETLLSYFSFSADWGILASTSYENLHTYVLARICNITHRIFTRAKKLLNKFYRKKIRYMFSTRLAQMLWLSRKAEVKELFKNIYV
jgi:hypothetical protein